MSEKMNGSTQEPHHYEDILSFSRIEFPSLINTHFKYIHVQRAREVSQTQHEHMSN